MLTALLLAALLQAPPRAAATGAPPDGRPNGRVPGVPLFEVPTAGVSGRNELAVLLSGDGGWAETDQGLAGALAQGGIPVVGWSSLRYFLHRKKPEQVAADLERVLRAYLPLWHKDRVILIGYSFGADVVPFLVNRLPPDLASKISLVVLMGPTGTADFHIHPGEWLRKPSDDSLPTRPEAEKMRGRQILCAYGRREKDSFCLQLGDLVHLLIRPGGHIVGKDYGLIAAWILGQAAGASPGSGIGAQ